MNQVILIGNLTKDPEHTTTTGGISICKFSIAVQRKFANQEGVREADFFDIVAWRSLADNCQKFLTKGKKVAITGSIQIRNYEDKEGVKRKAIDIQADNVEFLSPRDGDSGGEQYSKPSYKQEATPKTNKKAELEPVEDDDLPF